MKGFHPTAFFGRTGAAISCDTGARADRAGVAQAEIIEDPRPVLVAIDGSSGGWDALEWAAAEAAARLCVLRIVHAFSWPMGVDPSGVVCPRVNDKATVETAERLLGEGLRRARRVAPELEVETYLETGPPGSAICREGRDDALIVLGRGRSTRTFLARHGMHTRHVVRRAKCPVVVVGLAHEFPAGPSVGRVVVGVDSPRGLSSLFGFAFRSARRRGVGVTILHVWSPRGHSEAMELIDDPTTSELAKRRHLDDALPAWRSAFPDVGVKERLIQGRAAPVLVSASASAALLVVGSGAGDPFPRTFFGSVSKEILRSAQCPVAVIKEPKIATLLSLGGGVGR